MSPQWKNRHKRACEKGIRNLPVEEDFCCVESIENTTKKDKNLETAKSKNGNTRPA